MRSNFRRVSQQTTKSSRKSDKEAKGNDAPPTLATLAMGLTNAQTSAAASTCRGLVCIRQTTPLSGSRRGGSGAILLDARMGDACRLNEDEWYFCVLQTMDTRASIQWFSIRGEGDASDEDDGGSCTRSDSVLVAVTVISHFEVVDDSSASEKAHDNEEEENGGEHERALIPEFNGLKLDAEECTFYMEDHVQGVSVTALRCGIV